MLDNSDDENYNILEDATDLCDSSNDQISKKVDESSLEKDYKKELENNPLKLPENNQSIPSLDRNENSNKS